MDLIEKSERERERWSFLGLLSEYWKYGNRIEFSDQWMGSVEC